MQIAAIVDTKIVESMSYNGDNKEAVVNAVKENLVNRGYSEDQFSIIEMNDADFFAKINEQNELVPKQPTELEQLKKQQELMQNVLDDLILGGAL
jgi:hypothetical protein